MLHLLPFILFLQDTGASTHRFVTGGPGKTETGRIAVMVQQWKTLAEVQHLPSLTA